MFFWGICRQEIVVVNEIVLQYNKNLLIQNEEINVVELKYYPELDESAEYDVRLFWHIVNRRRKTKSSNVW